jgi:hypothetical protein
VQYLAVRITDQQQVIADMVTVDSDPGITSLMLETKH